MFPALLGWRIFITGVVQDCPGPQCPSQPRIHAVPVASWVSCLPGTWALSSCAHLVLLGQEAVPAALLWRGTVKLPAPEQQMEGMTFGDSTQANLGLCFKANQWIWMSDSN